MAERRTAPADRRADAARGVAGERRTADNRSVGAAMVDALEDILQWERASERSMKVAEKASTPKLPN